MVRERVAAAGRTRLPLGACVHAMCASGHALYTQAGPVSIALTLRSTFYTTQFDRERRRKRSYSSLVCFSFIKVVVEDTYIIYMCIGVLYIQYVRMLWWIHIKPYVHHKMCLLIYNIILPMNDCISFKFFFYRDPNKVNAKICDHFADPKLSNAPLDDENENTEVSMQGVLQRNYIHILNSESVGITKFLIYFFFRLNLMKRRIFALRRIPHKWTLTLQMRFTALQMIPRQHI